MTAPVYPRGGASPPPPVSSVDLPGVPLFSRGKVREMYDLGEHLLMVASDRISAFDVVMNEPVPGKGMVLTALSEFWFGATGHVVPNHVVSGNVAEFPLTLHSYAHVLEGRSLLVKKARRVDIECVVRGYLAGSAWAEYRRHGAMAGEPLPVGLVEAQKLTEPLFTPATKAETGHDENITIDRMKELVGSDLTDQVQQYSLDLYTFAEAHARRRGIILADTKFEFGVLDGRVILIDELLTPDSSRFWPADTYRPGQSQPSFDKQHLRDYLEQTGWNKEPPAPPLPPKVIQKTSEKYHEAYLRLAADV